LTSNCRAFSELHFRVPITPESPVRRRIHACHMRRRIHAF
jgi:hypothetical protein